MEIKAVIGNLMIIKSRLTRQLGKFDITGQCDESIQSSIYLWNWWSSDAATGAQTKLFGGKGVGRSVYCPHSTAMVRNNLPKRRSA